MLRRSLIVGLLAAGVAPFARAEHFLDAQAAVRILFPDADDVRVSDASLTKPQAKEVRKTSGMRVRQRDIRRFTALRQGQVQGWVYVDDVIGKHEFITYATAIGVEGRVAGVEIMDYRETWGGDVRLPTWRIQFAGLSLGKPPKLGDTIQNISGATLSCRNVSDGVRRILTTHALLQAQNGA